LGLDVVQARNQSFVICFDALESLRWQSVIRGPCGNQTVYAVHSVRGRRVDREIG
jgi:hypothetical protein